MAAYEKLATLAHALYQRTLKGEIDWEVTVSDGVYQASFSNYSIKILLEKSKSVPDVEDVRISVFDQNGAEIESFTDVDIADEWKKRFSHVSDSFDGMQGTYEIARRSALGTEKAIDQILSELEGELPF